MLRTRKKVIKQLLMDMNSQLVQVVHLFGRWSEYPDFDIARAGNYYLSDAFFGAGSPLEKRQPSRIFHELPFTAAGDQFVMRNASTNVAMMGA